MLTVETGDWTWSGMLTTIAGGGEDKEVRIGRKTDELDQNKTPVRD